MKKKDKEMMKLREKVMESREEYFTNLQALDQTLKRKKEDDKVKIKD